MSAYRPQALVIWTGAAALVMVCAHAGAADATGRQRQDVLFTLGATRSDNITLASTSQQPETIAEAGLQLRVQREAGRLTADISSDLMNRHYVQNTYKDELTGNLTGLLAYALLPERLTWTVTDNYAQMPVNVLDIETPDNRQNVNFLSTGPDLLLRLGGTTQLNLGGCWSDMHYQTSDFDNRRYTGTLGVSRALNKRASLSINGSTERIDFPAASLNRDFDSSSAYLEFNAKGAKTSLDLRGGYTQLHDAQNTSHGRLLGIELTRSLTARTGLRLNVGSDLGDSADALRRDQSIGGVLRSARSTVAAADAFKSDYVTMAVDVVGARNSANISLDWRREDHLKEATVNRQRRAASVRLARQFTATVAAHLMAAYERDQFDQAGGSVDKKTAGMGVDWQLTRAIGLIFNGDHTNGGHGFAASPTASVYQENRVSLRLSYKPGG